MKNRFQIQVPLVHLVTMGGYSDDRFICTTIRSTQITTDTVRSR